ncbi:MAG TPA: endolytic transglycosylase MltG [Candidatus Limnocylindrales bacterium]
MTLRNGGRARSTGGPSSRSGDPSVKRPVLDTGWSDYDPNQPAGSNGPAKSKPEWADPPRNYRSSRSGGPGTVIQFVLFAVVAAAVVLGGLYFVAKPVVASSLANWAAENPTALNLPFMADIVRSELGTKLTQPVDAANATKVAFQVTSGETPKQIADELVHAGLIGDARAFVFESLIKNVSDKFISGRHVLSKSMTVDQIIAALITAPTAPPTIRIQFREGLRIEQMVAKLEYIEANPADPTAKLTLDVNQYYQDATNPAADLLAKYPWLKLPAGASLEGFLFPATYDVAPDITPVRLIEDQLDAFAQYAPPDLLALPPDQIYRTVQIASLVEPEVKLDSDRPLVAGVYVNRLDPKKWPTGLLNSNPSVTYASDSVWLADHPTASWVDYTFWVEPTSGPAFSKIEFPEKLAPYNTYAHGGLPPTPICSPGLASLQAAFAPDTKDGYYYFLATNDAAGTIVYAKTNAEQIANEQKYGFLPSPS